MSIRGKLIVAVAANRVVLRRLERVRRELDVVAGRLSVGDLDVRPPTSSAGSRTRSARSSIGSSRS